jgi:hypothetical protein
MSGTDEQLAIMDAELYWFGGQLSAPKVYDTGTNFHAAPTVRATTAKSVTALQAVAQSDRHIRAFRDDAGDWIVTIDEA